MGRKFLATESNGISSFLVVFFITLISCEESTSPDSSSQVVTTISCRKVFDVPNHKSETYYMVTTCLNKGNSTVTNKCIHESDALLDNVVVIGDDGHLYKNEYCALCNGIPKYTYVSITAKCRNTSFQNTHRQTIITKQTIQAMQQCMFEIDNHIIYELARHVCIPQTFCTTANTTYKECRAIENTLSIQKYLHYQCYTCSRDGSINSTQKKNYCSLKPCYLKNGIDSSKYTTSFTVSLDSSKRYSIKNLTWKFPIRQFLGIPYNYTFPRDKGLEQYLCHRFDVGARKTCCSCEGDCMRERTCCIDAFWNETNPLPYHSYLDWFLNKRQQTKKYTCQPVYPMALSLGHQTKYRLMVKECMDSSSSSSIGDHTHCLSPMNNASLKSIIPVLGSDGNLYANMFCAKCNLVLDYQYVNITSECETLRSTGLSTLKCDNVTFKCVLEKPPLSIDGCLFDISSDSVSSSKICSPKAKVNVSDRTCNNRISYNNQNKFHAKLCNSYNGSFGNYVNYHCWKTCDNVTINESNLPVMENLIRYCDDPFNDVCPSCIIEVDPTVITRNLFSFTISFSSEVSTLKTPGIDYGFTCQKDEIIDLKEMKCVKHNCPPNYQLAEGKCELKNVVYHSVMISDSQDISLPRQCVLASNRSFLYLITSRLVQNISEVFRQFPSSNSTIAEFSKIYSGLNETVYRMDATMNNEFLQLIESSSSLQLQLSLQGVQIIVLSSQIDPDIISMFYGWDPSRFYLNSRLCYKPKTLDINNVIFDHHNCSLTLDDEHYNYEDIALWLSLEDSTFMGHVAICEQFHLSRNCPRKILPDEYSSFLDSNNGTFIYINADGNDTYLPDEYIPLREGVSVCMAPFQKVIPKTPAGRIALLQTEYYLSISLFIISCLCYIWIVVTYLMFKEMRTIPGFNTCLMCVSLLICDFLYLVSLAVNAHQTACAAVAVARHWMALSAFVWTIVIAVDLVLTFNSLNLGSHDDIKQRVIIRCCFAFFLPAAVVIVAVILDTRSIVTIGYGLQGTCWMTNLYARLGFYIVPVACISLFTFLCLVYTLIKIFKDSKQTESILGKDKNSSRRKPLVKIALKLVLILGFTEFIGFLQIPGSSLSKSEEAFNTTFNFVYTIVRSCRGILLWFIYIVGGQMFKKYKKHLINSNSTLSRHSTFMSYTSRTTSTSV